MGEEEEAFNYERRLTEAEARYRASPNPVLDALMQQSSHVRAQFSVMGRKVEAQDLRNMAGQPVLKTGIISQAEAEYRLQQQMADALGMMHSHERQKVHELVKRGVSPLDAMKQVLGLHSPSAGLHTGVPFTPPAPTTPAPSERVGTIVWVGGSTLSVDSIRYENVTEEQAVRIQRLTPDQRKAFHERMGNASLLASRIADEAAETYAETKAAADTLNAKAEAAAARADALAASRPGKPKINPKGWRVMERAKKTGLPRRVRLNANTHDLVRTTSTGTRSCERCKKVLTKHEDYVNVHYLDQHKRITLGRTVHEEKPFHVVCVPTEFHDGLVALGMTRPANQP